MVEAGFVSGGEVLAGCFLILHVCICGHGDCMKGKVELSSYIQYVKQKNKQAKN